MTRSNKKRHIQLGMPFGTAQGRLRKMIMFQLLREFKKNICFQCGKEIETVEELSIEHKVAWLDKENAKELFWDLDNIAFSHLSCNSSVATRPTKGIIKHPSQSAYDKGCRCLECTKLKNEHLIRYRKRMKQENPMFRRNISK